MNIKYVNVELFFRTRNEHQQPWRWNVEYAPVLLLIIYTLEVSTTYEGHEISADFKIIFLQHGVVFPAEPSSDVQLREDPLWNAGLV